MGSEHGRRPPPHERLVLQLSLLAGLPGGVLGGVLLWASAWSLTVKIGLTCAVVVFWLGFARAAQLRVARSLLTLANMLGAVREGDFSVRGRETREGDALGLAFREANALTETLEEQRLGAFEATSLLRRVMAEVDVGIFAFDQNGELRVINQQGERMLGRAAERIQGRTASELGLAACLEGEPVRTVELSLPNQQGRWLLRRSRFRQGGQPHQLLVLSDASRALREEEHEAWKRLVRVLSHEINNSLAPIASVAGSLEELLQREPRASDWEEDLHSGLSVIAGRSDGLRRIMASYARLAKLPPPQLAELSVGAWVRRVAEIETRLPIDVVEGPPISIPADGDQLDQLLINLVGNAVDATLETGGRVRVGWEQKRDWLLVYVEDDGPGIADTSNLFVPFFSTKSGGSGIGLALSRQIAEGHDGHLVLRNRADASGCRAEVTLPVAAG
jgi:two-component system nitrogen regulation sensor histidine kinase NtrY